MTQYQQATVTQLYLDRLSTPSPSPYSPLLPPPSPYSPLLPPPSPYSPLLPPPSGIFVPKDKVTSLTKRE